MAFTTISAYFLFGIVYYVYDKNIINWDLNKKIHLVNTAHKGIFNSYDLIKSGIILFSLLNLLLIVVNGVDIFYYFIQPELLDGIHYSSALHQSIGAIITSVILAISLILFFLKDRLNFDVRSKLLKKLIYLWIVLNAFIIGIAFYKNALYINAYGLTFKRIGVYIYLVLTLIGLFITTIKVLKLKTNWYLYKNMGVVFLTCGILYSTINWEKIIIQHNINAFKNNQVYLDIDYLLTFSKNSIPQLIQIKEQNLIKDKPSKLRFEQKLNEKVKKYLYNRTFNWQSWHYQLHFIDTAIIHHYKK